jgi:hypothetical protein
MVVTGSRDRFSIIVAGSQAKPLACQPRVNIDNLRTPALEPAAISTKPQQSPRRDVIYYCLFSG